MNWFSKREIPTTPLSYWSTPDQWNVWSWFVQKYHKLSDTTVTTGTSRVVFVGKEWVYKIPNDNRNLIENVFEERLYRERIFPVAACSIVEEAHGITVLRMERVTIPSKSEFNPWGASRIEQYPWLTLLQDGRQVGWNKAGELVCYDAGGEGYRRGWTVEPQYQRPENNY